MTSRFRRNFSKRKQKKHLQQALVVYNSKRKLRAAITRPTDENISSSMDVSVTSRSAQDTTVNETLDTTQTDAADNADDNSMLMSTTSSEEDCCQVEEPKGSFVIPISKMLNFIVCLSNCAIFCRNMPVFNFIVTDGMYCKIVLKCKKCNKQYTLENSVCVGNEYQINCASVLAGFAVSLGYSNLCDIFQFLDLKFMDQAKYRKVEKKVVAVIISESKISMQNALKQEIELSSKADSIKTQLPEICAIGDAQWSKRSYNRNYNANACCGSLIGAETKKIIYLGFRNKYCSICATNKNRPHVCYKNWVKSSAEMESSILCEGFLKLKDLGAKITTFVADADANTYPTLQIACNWKIEKIDCENHLSRNIFIYMDNWRKSCKQPYANKAFINTICGTVGRILRFKLSDKQYLEKHLINAPLHAVGMHSACDHLYCDKEKEEAKPFADIAPLKPLQDYLQNISKRAVRLRSGVTSNIVESFFAVNGKMQHGKIKNFIQRGAFQNRCYAACLLFNNGPCWAYELASKFFQCDGFYFKTQRRLKSAKYVCDKIRKQSNKYKVARQKRKLGARLVREKTTAYGMHNTDAISEICNADDILQRCIDYYKQNIILNNNDILSLEQSTRLQNKCDQWFVERRKRITASNLGKFCKAKNDISLCNLSRLIAYPHHTINTKAILHGNKYEAIALQKYENLFNVSCVKSGLVVNTTVPFFAASPDAVVRQEGTECTVIEIKCPYIARSFSENDFIIDGKLPVSKRKIKFLKFSNNALTIVNTHNYYYQIQSIMFATNIQHAHFCVFASDTAALLVIPISRNDEFITNFIELVTDRYFRFYLPEISTNRKLDHLQPFFFTSKFFADKRKFFQTSLKINYCPAVIKHQLDSILDGKTYHIFKKDNISDIINNFGFICVCVRPDGHCILHAWHESLGIAHDEIVTALRQEYLLNQELYATYNTNVEELDRYLTYKEFSRSTVDLIIPMLCKIFRSDTYIFSSTDSSDHCTLQFVPSSNAESGKFVALKKSGEHYDALIHHN